MKQDLRQKIAQLLEKVDSKVLEAKLNQTMEMIKNGQHEEIAKKSAILTKMKLKLNLTNFPL